MPRQDSTCGRRGPASPRLTSAIKAQMPLEHLTVLASRCELDMAARRRLGRRRLRLWWRWCGCLGRCGCLGWCCGWRRLSRGGQRLLCSSRRCRDRRRDRLRRRCRDRWVRRNLPDGGWPDQCGERRAMCARFQPALPGGFHRGISPLRSGPRRHRQLCRAHHARGDAYQRGDHRVLGLPSPSTHSRRLRRRHAVMFRRGHTPAWPSRHAPNLRVRAKVEW